MSSPENTLSSFVTDLEFEDLSSEVIDTIQRAFVDTVGVTLAGAVEGAGLKAYQTAGYDSPASGSDILLGLRSDDPPSEMALRLGTASHALDYDDLSWALDGHPSVTLVPPLLALASTADASGSDLLTAYAAGFEVEAAIADPVSPTHYEIGWHATATFGAFGAAAAAARLLELDKEATRQALNIAASTPSGLKRNFGSMTKPLHAGLAARSGVTAAILAADGFTADSTAISGERGFWDLYGHYTRDSFNFEDSWALETDGIHIKAYPCCYFTHTSIAAAQALTEEYAISPEAVERVEVRAAQGAADALHHQNPATGLEAKFSMEYAVASAIESDRIGLSTFADETIDRPTVQRLRERVAFTVDNSLEYDSHAATVRIITSDDEFGRRQVNPPGTHTNPLSEAELRAKFDECASRALPTDRVDSLYETLNGLDSVADISGQLSRNL